MNPHDERPLFLLGPIAATLRWLEELANLLSGPLLVAGLAIALIDLLTDGQLLTAVPALLYAWAIAQAIGVDAQLVGAWDRAKRAMLHRQWWALLGLLVLGAVLAYVAFIAGWVFAVQQASHISESAALASLGMSATAWLWQRVGVSVFLVCLSGWTRYRTPRQTSIDDERAKIERELTLEPLRQQLRHTRLAGVRDAASALVGGPGTPITALVDHPSILADATPLPDGPGTRTQDGAGSAPQGGAPGSALDIPAPSDGSAGLPGAPTDGPTDEPPTPPPAPRPNRRGKAASAATAEGNGHDRADRGGRLALVPYLPDGDTREGIPPGAATAARPHGARRGKRRTRADLNEARKASRYTAIVAQAAAILDENPDTTKEALRAILHVRQSTANEAYEQWRYARLRVAGTPN